MHEPSELRDQAHFTLLDGLEGVRAAEAARDSSAETEALAQAVDCKHATRWLAVDVSEFRGQTLTQSRVPPVGLGILLLVLDLRGITGLQVIEAGRLHLDKTTFGTMALLGLLSRRLTVASTVHRHIGRDEESWRELEMDD